MYVLVDFLLININKLSIFLRLFIFFIKILTLLLFYDILCPHRLIESFQNKETQT